MGMLVIWGSGSEDWVSSKGDGGDGDEVRGRHGGDYVSPHHLTELDDTSRAGVLPARQPLFAASKNQRNTSATTRSRGKGKGSDVEQDKGLTDSMPPPRPLTPARELPLPALLANSSAPANRRSAANTSIQRASNLKPW